jgi:hypothetical protein
MAWFRSSKEKWRCVDFMTLVPARAMEFEAGPRDGQVVILQPRYHGFLFGRFLQARVKGPKRFIRIPLEDRGSYLWRNMDGLRTVGELTAMFEREFSEDRQDAPRRVASFVYHMLENGFIRFSNI